MQFIAILLSVGLLKYFGSLTLLHKDAWFLNAIKRAHEKLGENNIAVALLLILTPCVLLLLLLMVIEHWLGGLLELAVNVLVFIYAIGRGRFTRILRRYIEVLKTDNINSMVAQIHRIDSSYLPGINDSVSDVHYQALSRFIYQGFNRFFVVLFWFALLGPVAVLAYRLLCIYYRQHNMLVLLKIREILEWPAARMLGVTLAFVGDFGRSISVWLEVLVRVDLTSLEVLRRYFSTALNMSDEKDENKASFDVAVAASQVIDLQQILSRSMIFAVAFVAVYEIFI